MSANDNDTGYSLVAAELRQAFDQVFAAPDVTRNMQFDDFVGIRVGGRPFSLRVTELSRIEAIRKIVPLPGGNSWLLGVTNSQGKLVPVFSLELVLGFERTVGDSSWLAICGQEEPLGLTFDTLEGYSRIPRTDIITTATVESQTQFNQQTIREREEIRTVINLTQILLAIRDRI